MYEHPKRRKSWAEHSVSGFYVGTSDEHYRCHKVWVAKTKAERVSGTVYFKHKYITQPTLTPEDVIIKALQDLKHAIKGTNNHKGNENLKALEQMDEIFKQEPEKQLQEKEKQVQFENDKPEVVTYEGDPRVPLKEGAAQAKTGKELLTVPPRKAAQRPTTRRSVGGGVRNGNAPPRVARTVNAAVPRVTRNTNAAAPRVAPRRQVGVANTPAINTRSHKQVDQPKTQEQ